MLIHTYSFIGQIIVTHIGAAVTYFLSYIIDLISFVCHFKAYHLRIKKMLVDMI